MKLGTNDLNSTKEHDGMEKKKTGAVRVETPETEPVAETADQKLGVRKKIGPDGYAICGDL